jgi:hypothetical protein
VSTSDRFLLHVIINSSFLKVTTFDDYESNINEYCENIKRNAHIGEKERHLLS